MGLVASIDEAASRAAIPKLCYFALPHSYRSSGGTFVDKSQIDMLTRIVSMGKLHHAMTGTGAVAIAAAAAIPDTLVSRLLGMRTSVWLGHPSGRLRVGADACLTTEGWSVKTVSLSRSARRLMAGHLFAPC
jgi:2-methylaconitate cis-trans-isomerase PrpF